MLPGTACQHMPRTRGMHVLVGLAIPAVSATGVRCNFGGALVARVARQQPARQLRTERPLEMSTVHSVCQAFPCGRNASSYNDMAGFEQWSLL